MPASPNRKIITVIIAAFLLACIAYAFYGCEQIRSGDLVNREVVVKDKHEVKFKKLGGNTGSFASSLPGQDKDIQSLSTKTNVETRNIKSGGSTMLSSGRQTSMPILILFILFMACFGLYLFRKQGNSHHRMISFIVGVILFICLLYVLRGCEPSEHISVKDEHTIKPEIVVIGSEPLKAQTDGHSWTAQKKHLDRLEPGEVERRLDGPLQDDTSAARHNPPRPVVGITMPSSLPQIVSPPAPVKPKGY